MRTVGRHHPASAPRGETTAFCDYCGALWHRSKLRLMPGGLLSCPDEGNGKDAYTLNMKNAQAAARPRRLYRHLVQGKGSK